MVQWILHFIDKLQTNLYKITERCICLTTYIYHSEKFIHAIGLVWKDKNRATTFDLRKEERIINRFHNQICVLGRHSRLK